MTRAYTSPRTFGVKIFIQPSQSGDLANKSWHHHVVISSRQGARAHKATCNHKLISISIALFRMCARRPSPHQQDAQFFSLRAGRSKKPFPDDGTHTHTYRAIKAESKDLLESAAVVCAASLARVWLMAASRAICLVSAPQVRARSQQLRV
jgi:hypothetical protein